MCFNRFFTMIGFCLILIACGRSDNETLAVNTSPTTSTLISTNSPTAEPALSEIDHTAEAIKISEMATFTASDIGTPRPTNPPPYSSVPTTVPYQASFRTGLTADCEDIEPHLLRHTNCWTDIVNGQYVSVFAGADKRSPENGLLIVWTTTLDGTSSTSSAFYNSPTPTGAITITQVIGERVALVAENGVALAFNLTTRAWEDPSTLPTATPTALSTSTLTS